MKFQAETKRQPRCKSFLRFLLSALICVPIPILMILMIKFEQIQNAYGLMIISTSIPLFCCFFLAFSICDFICMKVGLYDMINQEISVEVAPLTPPINETENNIVELTSSPPKSFGKELTEE
jgi:uncharacterized Tic20 family protein